MFDAGEIALQLRQQFPFGAALKHLSDERAAGIEHVGGKGRGVFDEANDAQLIGLAMARRVGGHVGEHDIGAAAHHRQQFFRRAVGEEVELGEADARNFRHFQKIDRHHLALAVDGPDALGRDLAPAARRGAEVDHRDSEFEEAMLVVDLDQLVGRARAPSILLGLRHIGIVQLPFQPEFR